MKCTTVATRKGYLPSRLNLDCVDEARAADPGFVDVGAVDAEHDPQGNRAARRQCRDGGAASAPRGAVGHREREEAEDEQRVAVVRAAADRILGDGEDLDLDQ